MKLYQLYDTEARTIGGTIMQERNERPAIRNFFHVLTRKDTMPGQYPEQFILLELGEQDEDTGAITAHDKPRVVATGAAWAAANQKPEGPSLVKQA